MADGGDLVAVFKGLASDAAQAGEDIGDSMSRWFDDTADIEDENVARTLAADSENARALNAIRPDADTGSLGDATADGAGDSGAGGQSRIARLLSGDDGDAAADAAGGDTAGTGSGSGSGLDDAADGPSAAQGRDELTTVGDPVDVTTGDVVFAQADVNLGGMLPLVLERVHRSSHRTGRWLGRSWMSSFDQRLEVRGDRVTGAFADGRVLTWHRDNAVSDGGPGTLPVSGPSRRLRQHSDGAWTVTDPQRGWTWRFERRPGYWHSGIGGGQGELPLVSITDRAGHEINFNYGTDGAPTAVTHSAGYRVDVSISSGRISALALGPVSLLRCEYDDAGNLSGVVNSSGLPLRFCYDEDGRLAGWTDRAGHSYAYSYDEQGRCVRGESPSGAQSGTFSYEPGVTRHADSTGAVTVYELDASSHLAAVTDPLGGMTRFAHDDRGRVTMRTDPLGRITRYEYDGDGNLTRVTRPDGSTGQAEYDERSLPVALTAADGTVWRQAYDERGNRTELAAPGGTVTRYGYDENGHLASVTGPDGSAVTVTCDAAGLQTSETGPDGRAIAYERDAFGRITRVTGPDGTVTELTWTIEGQPSSRTFTDGTAETWEWDPDGHLARHVSPGGTATSYEYGAFDKTTAIEWQDGTRTEFGYDGELRLTRVIHGGLAWSYSHDPAGRLVAEADFNGAVTRYAYDAAGQLSRKVNASGQETTFAYDAAGNLVSLAADGMVTTFAYDRTGQLAGARNADADITFQRDVLGRVVAESCNGRTMTASYDAAGRIAQRTTPSGTVTEWSYNASGLPATMTASGRELRFGYDAMARETTRHLPGGAMLTQGWDPAGRLTAQSVLSPGTAPGPEGPVAPGAVLQRRAYAYGPDGYLTGVDDLLTGNRVFGLDAAGRVTTATGPGWAEQYSYDALSNISAATWPAVPPELAGGWLDTGPQGSREVVGTRTIRAGNVRYRHDAAGRVVARSRTRLSRKPETWHYEWDSASRLTSVTIPDGTAWWYRYDPFGRRIAKQHVAADGNLLEETRFFWHGAVLAEQSEAIANGEEITTWDYHPGTFTPIVQQSRRSLRDASQDEIDQRFYSIITDLTGTPAELVTPDGTVAGYQQHTLWGGTVWHPGGASTPLRFPGQYADPETGLHQNGQRYYDPVTGSYLSPDPLGLTPAPNPHSYVPNPHILIDPLGLEPGGATRNAPGFIGNSSGGTEDVRNIGRPDNQLVLSGHGGIRAGDGTSVTVPPGTTISMYSYHGETISDSLGNKIETANPSPVEVYHPGEKLPDYTLYPPDGLKILGTPRNVTVTSPTRLSELMQPNMGSIHWAACRSVV